MADLLPLVWAAIVAFAVIMYVIMDGFDLGLGILFPLLPDRAARDTAMNSVAPVWDANETWLVLGGAGLLAAFPLAYAVILPALYLPLIVMLIALIFRGVAFEFRFKSQSHRHIWSASFAAGSILATFVQGVALGAFIHGFEVVDQAYAGGSFDWLTPFALFTGVALVAGYALLGCTWLIMKSEGDLQRWACARAVPLLFLVLAGILAVSLWTPLLHARIAERWFTWPNILYLSPVPLVTAGVALSLLRALRRGRQVQPFVLSIVLFVLCYAGLAISLFPNVIPPDISIWQAAGDRDSLRFLLYGVGPILPVILAYSAYGYYVFRGKASADAGYH